MQLKLKELQKVAKMTVDEQKSFKRLCEEMYRVLGPSVVVPGNQDRVADAANEQLDILESTGRFPAIESFNVSVLLEAGRNKSAKVRKLVARLLPENHASRFLNDPSSIVRCAAAQRCTSRLIGEAVKYYPNDDQLITILNQKRLVEARAKKAKKTPEHFDLYGEEPLGSAVKQNPGEDMSDEWYEMLAHKLCSEYGGNIEGQWEETLASRVAASLYATSGVKVDRIKLLDAIYSCIEEREDLVLGESRSLVKISRRLMKESLAAGEEYSTLPAVEENYDPVQKLFEGQYSTSEYVRLAESIFSVKKSSIPNGIKKYRLGEGNQHEAQVPVLGRIPVQSGGITPSVEKALDGYVKNWNAHQSMIGEPYRLSWSPHPYETNMIGFNLELK